MPMKSAIPFCKTTDNDDGARTLPVSFVFSPSNPSVQAFKMSAADCGLGSVQSVYIDNSMSPAPTTLLIGQTLQAITAAAFSQGYYNVLNSSLDIDFRIVNFGGQNALAAGYAVNLQWLNVAAIADVWSTQSPSGLQGTPFALHVTAANTQAVLTANAVAGRTTFISGLMVTGYGSTAGGGIQGSLTNLDNTGAAQAPSAIQFELSVPASPAVLQPFNLSFSPPLPVFPGQAAVLTVPAFGAGNTAQSATLTGYYL